MDEMDRDSGKLEQIVSQFLLKILHVILHSRIPSLHPHDRNADLSSISRVKKSDRWFNLVLGDRPAALESLNFWHRNLLDPMIIDIILVRQGYSSSSVDTGPSTENVIERWAVQYESPRNVVSQSGDSPASYKKTYKKSIILVRSLYSQLRLLPAYRIFRLLNSSTQTYNFHLIYKVSSFSDPLSRAEEDVMREYSFVPVEALPGRLCVSVTYRPTLSDFNLESSVPLPPTIIADYVGSPTTEPLRSFLSSEKGFHATSFPLTGERPPYMSPLQRPHSWTSGFQRAAPFMRNQPLAGSPPAYHTPPTPYGVTSPRTNVVTYTTQNYRLPIQQKATFNDEYQLSPPFSPSASPSTPTYLSSNSPLQPRIRSETAPVTIPRLLTGKNSRIHSPNYSDPNRHSLPPLSPRNAKHDHSFQESLSGIRSFRKIEALQSGEIPASLTNHYCGQKVVKDIKNDSGRFSRLLSPSDSPRTGFSRCSSRLSLQDDLDDFDFSCPFDVDDVDTYDNLARQNIDGRRASDIASHSASLGRKSQNAAVGILVHMLRTAPSLRQDTSSSSHLLRTEFEGGVDTASGFFKPRTTSDALEELRSYREIKDLLLSKSGTQVVRKEET